MLTNGQNQLEECIELLFAPDTEARAEAVCHISQCGAESVPLLMQIVLRPLGYALDRWPDWQQMLPAQAIMTRCANAQQAAIEAMGVIGAPAVSELSGLLESRDTNLRELAANALRRMDAPEALDALHGMLEQEMQAQQKARRKWHIRRALGSFGIALLVLLLSPVGEQPHIEWFYVPACGLAAWLLLGFTDRGVRLRRTAVSALAQSGDTRHIGVLTACLSDPDADVRRAVVNALTHLLPHVRVEDKEHLTDGERKSLVRALDGDSPELAVAVLSAMQQIGDARVLRRVAFLIDSPLHVSSVREAAHECLPHVKQRVKEAQDAQDLLRSTCAGQAVVSADLLRPVRDQKMEQQEEQLLHPH